MKNHLAWNEDDQNDRGNSGNQERKETKVPSDKDRQHNPWAKSGRNKNDDGLPDLDEYFKKGQKWLKQMVGNNSKKPFGSDGGDFGGDKPPASVLFGMSFIILAILIGIMGFYKVEPGERAVEYRFGKYLGMQGPGPHWIFPMIYTKEIYNTDIVHQRNFEDDLITKEVNIVSVSLAVQYKIGNLEDYLFKVRSADDSLAEATRAAIRQVIAESTLDEVLSTRGKSAESYLGDQIQSLIVENLKLYQAGLDILGVEVLSAVPPQQVKEAFNDAIQAQEDEIRYQNQAEAYERKVVPVAEGQAARILQEANAYAAQTVLAAEGDVARFNAILPEYKSAPAVTRNRLYLSAMENILKNTPKILVDSKSNNVLFLPLDKLKFNNLTNNEKQEQEKAKQEKDLVDSMALTSASSPQNIMPSNTQRVTSRLSSRDTTRETRNIGSNGSSGSSGTNEAMEPAENW